MVDPPGPSRDRMRSHLDLPTVSFLISRIDSLARRAYPSVRGTVRAPLMGFDLMAKLRFMFQTPRCRGTELRTDYAHCEGRSPHGPVSNPSLWGTVRAPHRSATWAVAGASSFKPLGAGHGVPRYAIPVGTPVHLTVLFQTLWCGAQRAQLDFARGNKFSTYAFQTPRCGARCAASSSSRPPGPSPRRINPPGAGRGARIHHMEAHVLLEMRFQTPRCGAQCAHRLQNK